MPAIDDTGRLLDLLTEAGDEAVTLDELEVVGVIDPARALFELERRGHAVHRVYENRVTCVRLAKPDDVPTEPPPPPPGEAPPRAPSGLALLALLLVALGVIAARRR
jgi:hypothetical protein